jgi:tetratricopeptide (TPR) repeat protein
MKSLHAYLTLAFIAFQALMLTSNSTHAENPNEPVLKIKEAIEQADLKFDRGLYMKAHADCERILASEPDNAAAEYYLTYTEYKLLLIGMMKKEKSAFTNYYYTAIEHARNLSGNEEYRSEGLTLLAAIYMMKLASDPNEGPALAPKIHDLLDKAEEDNPDNPRIYIIRGHMLKNTPEFFGGSLKGAVKEFKYAVSIFEESTPYESNVSPAWGHLEALCEMGNIYSTLKDYEAARAAYEKALQVEPGYGYVKYKLLPELDKKLSSSN